ncbi:MerR family transcriptional regulator [Streptomyces sp. NPDC005890]|uniref:MerR family transcriptional regulator n=1 Tax=Streptomyces sp. NPDC005890 TaxID=3154568 RepID=UPI0033C8AEDA
MTTAPTRQQPLSIGEVARQTGLSVHVLRFYERQHLLIAPVERTTGGRRRYTTADVEWPQICIKLRESGMPVADLKQFAELVRRGPGNETERLRLLHPAAALRAHPTRPATPDTPRRNRTRTPSAGRAR